MRIHVPDRDSSTTWQLLWRLGVSLILAVLGIVLIGRAWSSSALPLAVIGILIAAPCIAEVLLTLAALIRRMASR